MNYSNNTVIQKIIKKRRDIRTEHDNWNYNSVWISRADNAEFAKIDAEYRDLKSVIAKKDLDGKAITKTEVVKFKKLHTAHTDMVRKLHGKNPFALCPDCDNHPTKGDVICECVINEYHKGLDWMVNSSGFESVNFEKVLNGQPQDVVEQYKRNYLNLGKYVGKFSDVSKPNLLLMGKTGTGKTHSAKLLATEIMVRGFHVEFVKSYEMIEYITDAVFKREGENFDKLLNCDLLVIDDLGTEATIPNITEEKIYSIINRRLEEKKPFIITTNLDQIGIAKKYDDRITSRIFAHATTNIISFTASDLRIKS